MGFDAAGKQLFVGGADKTVTVVDPATGRVVRKLPKQTHPVAWLATLGDGLLVTGSFSEASMDIPGATVLWDLGAGSATELVADRLFKGGGVLADGSLLLASTADRALVLWSLR